MMTLDELIAAYPIYQNVRCGVTVRPGWVPILEGLAQALTCVEGVELMQVKQKLGGLRVYAQLGSSDDALVGRAIAWACEQASRTCEVCGRPGETLSIKGYIQTLCETCKAVGPTL